MAARCAFLALAALHVIHTHGATCPGELDLTGYGTVSIIPTGWMDPDGGKPFVVDGNHLIPHMDSRAYIADVCTAGVYSNEQYIAPNLLGKAFRYTTDISGAGCGCNAALYLVSMRQNQRRSTCGDYYCDANNVCGESCAEIDIQEANRHAWHSTLHTAQDHGGLGKGYGGGGVGWSGPRDWTAAEYGPGGRCVDTTRPFVVEASFPIDAQSILLGMNITLSQTGSSCPLVAMIDQYKGLAELSQALRAGMTPVMSYWRDKDMLWMDGEGGDGSGPCGVDQPLACSETIRYSDLSIRKIGGPVSGSPTTDHAFPWSRDDGMVEPLPSPQHAIDALPPRSPGSTSWGNELFPAGEQREEEPAEPWHVPLPSQRVPFPGATESEPTWEAFPGPIGPIRAALHEQPAAAIRDEPAAAMCATCPGSIDLQGHGPISVVPAGWMEPDCGSKVEVIAGKTVSPHLGARAYFASSCSVGKYVSQHYLAVDLRGKTMRYTSDLSGAGCGCNAGVLLTGMRHNSQPSKCSDYYCDANAMCGEQCSEIDLQEANMFAWRTSLHTEDDPVGSGKGYGGGGAGWNGPRDWSADDYGPHGRCIDTLKPFQVAVSFPVDGTGMLQAVEVILSQAGSPCPLTTRLDSYQGLPRLSAALAQGMTPVVSYWGSDDLLWLDGRGDDEAGPCAEDRKSACSESVKFYGFTITDGAPPEQAFMPRAQSAGSQQEENEEDVTLTTGTKEVHIRMRASELPAGLSNGDAVTISYQGTRINAGVVEIVRASRSAAANIPEVKKSFPRELVQPERGNTLSSSLAKNERSGGKSWAKELLPYVMRRDSQQAGAIAQANQSWMPSPLTLIGISFAALGVALVNIGGRQIRFRLMDRNRQRALTRYGRLEHEEANAEVPLEREIA